MDRQIGIAVATVGTRDLAPSLTELMDKDSVLTIQYDRERQGVARTRNRALRTLLQMGCTDVILLDDDVVPLVKSWDRRIVNTARVHGVGVMGYPDPRDASRVSEDRGMDWWQFCIGCMLYISAEAVEKLGYFGQYRQYGHEDIGYLARARMAGLSGAVNYGDATPTEIAQWLRALDIYPTDGFDQEVYTTHAEKKAGAEKGRAQFEREVQSGELYIPYWD